jgi:uncharacterized protein YkwD
LRSIRRVAVGTLLTTAIAPPAVPAAEAAPEDAMVREVNRIRLANGLDRLRRSSSLHRSSARYARRLMRRDAFGHQAGVSTAGRFEWAGENLELHWGWDPQPRSTVRRWMSSPGHRAVILSPRWGWLGVGRSLGRFNSGAATIWVAHFGKT